MNRKSLQQPTSAGKGLTRRSFVLAVPGVCVAAPWSACLWSAEAYAGTSASLRSRSGPTGLSSLPALNLRSAQARTLAPFCVGQAFAEGAVGAAQFIVSDIAEFQVNVLNRWRDGSVKFALLSGRVDLSANLPRVLALTTGPAPTGTDLNENDLLASGVTASIAYSPYGSVQLSALIGVVSLFQSGRWTAGRVATLFVGSECASWLYYAPVGADAHLSAWFEVRLWRGGSVEILPWLENGNLNVPAPAQRSGTATFVMAGSTRFAATLSLEHHTRAVLASGSTLSHWLDSSMPVEVRHDTAYLQSTRLLPAYHGVIAANNPIFAGLVSNYVPLAQANLPAAMGSAGYHPSIGPLPEWDVAYLCSSADPRAAAAVQINAYCAGRYSIHYRDETSNRPLAFSQYPNLVLNGSNSGVGSVGSSSNNSYTPLPGTGGGPVWASSHHPSLAYLAYLISGRQYFREEMQFAATLNFLKQTDVQRGVGGVFRTNVGANTTRGAAWALRTLGQACCITPDVDPLRAEFLASVDANVRAYYSGNAVPEVNPQGVCAPYSDYTSGDGIYMHASWMEDFLTTAWGMIADLELPLASDALQQLDVFFAWKARSIIGRLGAQGDAQQYNYRDAAQYNLAVAPSDTPNWSSAGGPWYADWGAIYQATTGGANLPDAATNLRGGNFPEATSYWGNLQPAIAYAINRGVPGALAAYQRMTAASNWSQIQTGWNSEPVWGVKPHASSSLLFNDGFE